MKLKPTRDKILKDLRTGIVSFSFKKKNGDLREMKATLAVRLMPEDKIPETDHNFSLKSTDTIRCFDTEIKDWRSFNVNTLESYDGLIK